MAEERRVLATRYEPLARIGIPLCAHCLHDILVAVRNIEIRGHLIWFGSFGSSLVLLVFLTVLRAYIHAV